MIDLKKQIKLINELISDEIFLSQLCAFFNNNEKNVDKALGLIIAYYLNTLDPNFGYTLEELLKKITIKTDQNFLYAPVDATTAKYIRIFGINNRVLDGELPVNVQKVAESISFDPISRKRELLFRSRLIDAIKVSKPRVLYTTLFKEPKGEEKAIDISEPEQEHYTTILKDHISRVARENTGALISDGKKIVNKYIDSKRHIIVVRREQKEIDLGSKVGTYEAMSPISIFNIGFLELPSTYKIKQLCLKGGLPQPEYKEKPKFQKPQYLVRYYRYELVPITDDFDYYNDALTGDADYDIDILYHKHDNKDSKSKISSLFDENLRSIKKSTEVIQLTKYGDKYEINNGRHRLIYLKHMFKRMTDPNTKAGFKPIDFQVPAIVNHGIESEEVNNLLLTIQNRHTSTRFLKDNISNDRENIIIMIGNKVYKVENIEELKEFVYSQHQDKYLIGINAKVDLNYNYIICKILYVLKGNYTKLSFSDVVNIIKRYGVDYDGKVIKTDTLNFLELYRSYVNIVVHLSMNKVYYPDKDMMDYLKHKIDVFNLGRKAVDFINNYPENLDISIFELPTLLRESGIMGEQTKILVAELIKEFQLDKVINERNERIRKKRIG